MRGEKERDEEEEERTGKTSPLVPLCKGD